MLLKPTCSRYCRRSISHSAELLQPPYKRFALLSLRTRTWSCSIIRNCEAALVNAIQMRPHFFCVRTTRWTGFARGEVIVKADGPQPAEARSNELELIMAEQHDTLRTAIFSGDVRAQVAQR